MDAVKSNNNSVTQVLKNGDSYSLEDDISTSMPPSHSSACTLHEGTWERVQGSPIPWGVLWCKGTNHMSSSLPHPDPTHSIPSTGLNVSWQKLANINIRMNSRTHSTIERNMLNAEVTTWQLKPGPRAEQSGKTELTLLTACCERQDQAKALPWPSVSLYVMERGGQKTNPEREKTILTTVPSYLAPN